MLDVVPVLLAKTFAVSRWSLEHWR
jgi:hypothetical protein